MARRFKSVDDFERHLKSKWGIGELNDYKPWFTVRDVKDSKAFRKEITGLCVNRQHHLLSALELSLFATMDFRNDVYDIREQFPLFPLALSRKIALTLDVKHPQVVGVSDSVPFVMTTDLLVTFKNKEKYEYVAFCVKPESKANDPNVLAKIEIERVWWESIGVTFKIFTGNETVKTQSHNILWATDIQRHGLAEYLDTYIADALQLVPIGKSSKHNICDMFSKQFRLDAIDSINLLRLLIGKKRLQVDLSSQHLDISRTIDVLDNTNFIPETAYVSGY